MIDNQVEVFKKRTAGVSFLNKCYLLYILKTQKISRYYFGIPVAKRQVDAGRATL